MVVEDEGIFSRFREDAAALPLNEHQDITDNDLEALSGLPSYPPQLTTHPSFKELWDEGLHPALWGYHTRLYLSAMELRRERCRRLPASTLSQELRQEYNRLVQEWKTIYASTRHFGRTGDTENERVAMFNCRWMARRILYTAEDLKALVKGSDGLLFALCDRAYDLGRGIS